MTTATQIYTEDAALERSHIAYVRAWSGRIGDWTLRAAALRQEREALEQELSDESARMVMELVKRGHGLQAAEKRVEQLLERAFTPVAE